MITETTYKKQGNGVDSWIVKVWENEDKKELLSAVILYENPAIEKKQDISKIDIDTLTDFELKKLAKRIKKELNL
jgi:hypothetical protein